MASVFSFWQIAWSAGVALAGSLLVLLLARRWQVHLSVRDSIILALVVGLSLMLYRSAANIPSLNNDPIPAISPNDVLCPVVTSVGLTVYAGAYPLDEQAHFARVRAWLVLVSFAVNVITI